MRLLILTIGALVPLSAIFHIYHGEQWWRSNRREPPSIWQATGKLAASSRVHPFCYLQSRVRTLAHWL